MDDRYAGLTAEACERWIDSMVAQGRCPELWGFYPSASSIAADILQVLALTTRPRKNGDDVRPLIGMVGVAVDVIQQDQWDDRHILSWLGEAVLCLADNYGPELQAMRPKTMTWKPMQRFHDLLRDGLVVCKGEASTEAWHASVIDERDRGDALHWIIRIEKCTLELTASVLQEGIVDCTSMPKRSQTV